MLCAFTSKRITKKYIIEKTREFWAVGSSYGGTNDQTQRFLEEGIWEDGCGAQNVPDGRYKKVLNEIQIGDVLIMKSSATKGKGHSITFTKLKAIGIVTEIQDWFRFTVNWLSTIEFPLDFDSIRYSSTIQKMREDKLLNFAICFLDEHEL